jgi:hypothetical protein
MSRVERRYALTKARPGDYLLLSNDGRTMWRLTRYQDGPSYGLDDWPRDRWFWQAARWPEPITPETKLSKQYDIGDLSRWYVTDQMLATREEAIQCALAPAPDPRGGSS